MYRTLRDCSLNMRTTPAARLTHTVRYGVASYGALFDRLVSHVPAMSRIPVHRITGFYLSKGALRTPFAFGIINAFLMRTANNSIGHGY